MSEIYENIKKLRIERGLSQEELAAKMGYTSRSTIAKIESGTNDIPQAKIKAFAKALGTTPAHLMGIDNEQSITENDNNTNKILNLANSLNTHGKKKVIDYMENLLLNPAFSSSTKNDKSSSSVIIPVAARGEVSEDNILTKEEYIKAENTNFEKITPKKQLPKFLL